MDVTLTMGGKLKCNTQMMYYGIVHWEPILTNVTLVNVIKKKRAISFILAESRLGFTWVCGVWKGID